MAFDLLALPAVFSLEEAAVALGSRRSKRATSEYLKYHVSKGRLLTVTREVYAQVPPGVDPERFQPDPFLVLAATRADAVIAFHGALELQGVAHSHWGRYVAWSRTRRAPVRLGSVQLDFLPDPQAVRNMQDRAVGTRTMERSGCLLKATGPERTLVEGFLRVDEAGGAEELVESARGFEVLDLKLLERMLASYDLKRVWAAVGWFLEATQQSFAVPDGFLELCSRNSPQRPQYLSRGQRGGTLVKSWNLILPEPLAAEERSDAGQP